MATIELLIMSSKFGLFAHFEYYNRVHVFLKKGPFPAFISLFSSFQYKVDSRQMFNTNKFLPMTGFELQTYGIGSNRSTNWAKQPLPY